MKLTQKTVYLLQFCLFVPLNALHSVAAEEVKTQSSIATITPTTNISSRSKISRSAKDLLAQNQITQVTGIQINYTDKGLEIVLETRGQLVPLILPEGNNLAIDILDATLALPTEDEFREINPTEGIAEVTLTQIDETSIRLTITGENQTPNAEVVPSQQDLVLSITPEATTAQTPDEETEIIATGEGEDDNDDYVVDDATTATRTDTPLIEIPQSIQVVPQQVIKDQQANRL